MLASGDEWLFPLLLENAAEALDTGV